MERALIVEGTKFRRSPVALIATVVVVVVVPALSLAMTWIVGGNTASALALKAEALVGDGGWGGYLNVAAQVSAAAVFVASGFVVSWMFGREYAERTFPSLFALPVSLRSIASSKLIVIAVWSFATAVLMALVAGTIGAIAGLEVGDADVVSLLIKLFVVSFSSSLMAMVVAIVASVSRGYFAAVGAVIVLVACGQLSVLFGVGGWFPIAVPGLLAVAGTEGVPDVTLPHILFASATVVGASFFTVWWWGRSSAV